MNSHKNIILSIAAFIVGVRTMPTDFDLFPPETTELDIAFIMDATGSMTDYIDNARQNIHQVVTEIVQSSPLDVKMALIEYRDHPPLDRRFVIRQHDFTSSIRTMETWLGDARASGGGDTPEAVADALDGAAKLSWRTNSAKIGVLISDAPPHGLVPSLDRAFDDGCPLGYDPMKIIRDLAQIDVTLYTVGCEPTVIPYTDYFMALAYLTGGQYIPLEDPNHLIDAIIGGAQEELSLQKFTSLVEKEIQYALGLSGSSSGTKAINETAITQSVYQKLSKEGAKAKQLLLNNQTLAGASARAKAIAECKTMAEVRKIWHQGSTSHLPYRPPYFSGSGTGSGIHTGGGTGSSGSFGVLPSYAPVMTYRPGVYTGTGAPTPSPYTGMPARPTSISGSGFLFGGSGSGHPTALTGTGLFSGSGSGSSGSSHPGKFSYVDTAITFDQINRLVNKEVSKMSKTTK